MSQKGRKQSVNQELPSNASASLATNNSVNILAPIILVTGQQSQQISPTSSTSSHNALNNTINNSNTNNLLNTTLPLPNASSFNSSLTASLSSSILASSITSSSSSSTSSLSANHFNLTSNKNDSIQQQKLTQPSQQNQLQQQNKPSNFLATNNNNNNSQSNLSSFNSSSPMLISTVSLNKTQNTVSSQVNSTNISRQEANTTNSYSNDASNSILSSNNKSISNNSISVACSESKGQNAVAISLNYYNDQQLGNGHFFTKKTFHKPTYCHHCTEMLWGLIGQGFVCEVCNFVSHEKCQKSVVSPCSSIAHSLIKNPVPHCWSEPTHFKKKFCNICRKRLDDQYAFRCEICEYYIHTDCQVLAVNDCCETATFVPSRSLSSVTHHHHWREGNLPSNSKCSVCKKSCWTYECLAGMKCEWCGITTHSICRTRIEDECNFGNLRDIIVPPYAVSVPRIDMNKETILGIPTNNRPKGRSNSYDWNNIAIVDFKEQACEVSLNSPSLSSQQISNKSFNNLLITTNNSSQLNELNNSHENGNFLITTQSSSPNANTMSVTSIPQAQPAVLAATTLNVQSMAAAAAAAPLSSTSSSSPSPIGPGNHPNSNPSPCQTKTSQSSDRHSSQSSSALSITSGSSKKKDKYKQQADEEEDSKEIIKVYSGNASFRKRMFRTITVSKTASNIAIVEASLRTFHINDDPNRYYMTVPLSASNMASKMVSYSSPSSSSCLDDYQIEELIVDETNPIKSIKSALFNSNNLDGPKPSILLRYKDSESESIRIYPGIIKETSCYQRVTINLNSTVLDTIQMALEKFQMNKKNTVDKYSLVEVLLDHNVNERILNPNELPLQVIRKLRKESLCNNRMVRFYLQQKEDPHGPSVALFVGNLPSSLSQIQYEKILMDTFKNNNEIRWNKFDVIYYEYGSMVILYDDSEKAVRAYNMLKDSTYENKQLKVLLLPTIQHQMIPPNVCPLLVFVNVKSGGKQGADLITSFRHLLNPHQVFDLQNGGPLPGLYVFRNIESYRILACGGDGTIGWVLSCLDNVSQDAKCQSPPMAIVPLGTGNDLARVLRWGTGYTGAEEPLILLKDVIDAEEISLDRWTVVFHPDENKELDDIKKQLQIAVNVNQANTNEDNTEIYVMNNYFGIGIDAAVSLDFHTAREENPSKFNSRLHNKKFYFQACLRKIMTKGNCKEFNQYVTLEVDGRKIDLPQIEGILILNILSWASGAKPWGPEIEDQFQKPTHHDGMLEVVGIRGVVHMGQISGGLSNAIRLAQGGRIKIRVNTDIPVHVDGEPWLQSPCAITILKSALKATMLKKSKTKMKRRNTEPNINAPIAPNNSSESSGNRAETDPVDPEGIRN